MVYSHLHPGPSEVLLPCTFGQSFVGTDLPRAVAFLVVQYLHTTNNPISYQRLCQVPKSTVLRLFSSVTF